MFPELPYLLFLEHNHIFFSRAQRLALFSRIIVAPCHCRHLSLSILRIFLNDFNIITNLCLNMSRTFCVVSIFIISQHLHVTFHAVTLLFFPTKTRKCRFKENKNFLPVSNISKPKLNKSPKQED